MKKLKSFIKAIMKIVMCPIILWPLMVVTFQHSMFEIGFGGRGDYDRSILSIEYENAPDETAYVDILVKMDQDDPNYVEFTKPPKRFVRKYTDENGTSQREYVELSITAESQIAKWKEGGYVSLTLHHKGVRELMVWRGYESAEGSYVSTNEDLEVDGVFTEDYYRKYGNVRVAYVDKDGKVLNITDKSKKKYSGWDSDLLLVDGESVVFQIGEAAPWTVVLFQLLLIIIPFYTIWLIIRMIKFLYKGFFV